MKAYSRKQIKHRLEKIDTLENNFEREVIKTYGETEGIKFEKTAATMNLDGLDYAVCRVYDEKEDGQKKTFFFGISKYEINNKAMIKVIKVIS
jgi:hypothetical protein